MDALGLIALAVFGGPHHIQQYTTHSGQINALFVHMGLERLAISPHKSAAPTDIADTVTPQEPCELQSTEMTPVHAEQYGGSPMQHRLALINPVRQPWPMPTALVENMTVESQTEFFCFSPYISCVNPIIIYFYFQKKYC